MLKEPTVTEITPRFRQYVTTVCMEAYHCYPNTIQQAIAHTYMGCPYTYRIGIHPICIQGVPYAYGISHRCRGQYTYTGQNISKKSIRISWCCLVFYPQASAMAINGGFGRGWLG